MGIQSSVYGIRPADEKFKEMEKIYHLCNEQGIKIPEAVENFFAGERPDSSGVVVNLESYDAVTPYNADMRDGFEVDLRKLPKDIRIVRFVNNY